MFAFLNTIEQLNDTINGLVWGPYMLVLLVGTGIFFTLKLNFFQVTKFVYAMKQTLMKIFVKTEDMEEGEITPFQAVSTALAATVGTGNIAGVATAIALGGPGAIFWMWVSAFFGMMTKFAEVVLSIQYREKNVDGDWVGGPMYYIKNGLGKKWLASLFAVLGAFAAFGIGNMVQSNSVAASINATFGVPNWVTGVVLAVAASLVIFGGVKRIASVTEKLVPFMALFYIAGALLIILLNITNIPAAFGEIFAGAFSGRAAVGGFAGAAVMHAMRFGIARGVFTNEAGLGSAPIAHAAAKTDHPVRQGLWGIFEVFVDTILICSVTALAILSTGVWQQINPATGKALTGAALTTAAFNQGLPGPGGVIVAIGILLFAFSTILGWEYYGEKCAEYLFGTKITKLYKILWIPLVFVGTVANLELIWNIADTMNGLMAIPNLVGILGLSGVVFKLTKEFFADKSLVEGKGK